MSGPMRVTRRGLLFPPEAHDSRTWAKEALRVVHRLISAAQPAARDGSDLARAVYMIATSAKPDGMAPDDALHVLGRVLLRVYQAGMLHAATVCETPDLQRNDVARDLAERIRSRAYAAGRES